MDTFYDYLTQLFQSKTSCLSDDFKKQYNLFARTPEEQRKFAQQREEYEKQHEKDEKRKKDAESSSKMNYDIRHQKAHIHDSMRKLEQCMIANTKYIDTTKPYDKTFTCDLSIYYILYSPDSFEMYTKQELQKEYEVDVARKHLHACNLSSVNSDSYEKYFSSGKPDKLDDNIIGKNKFMMVYKSNYIDKSWYNIHIRVSNTTKEVPKTLDEMLDKFRHDNM